MSACQKALLTPELLGIIIQVCDQGTQAKCCRVCAMWQEIALNFLWEDVGKNSRRPTMQDLCDQMPPGDDSDFDTAAWKKFRRILARIRSLRFDYGLPPSGTERFGRLCASIGLITPQLQSLDVPVWYLDTLQAASAFVSHRITSFHIQAALLQPSSPENLRILWDMICAYLDRITSLRSLSLSWGAERADWLNHSNVIIKLIFTHPMLHTVGLPARTVYSSPALWASLGQMNHLRSLDLISSMLEPNWTFDTNPVIHPNTFCHLQEIRLVIPFVDIIELFSSQHPPPSLEHIAISSRAPLQSFNLGAVFESLCCVEWKLFEYISESFQIAEYLGIDQIRYLGSQIRLETLYLAYVILSDDEIDELARMIPNIVDLNLFDSVLWEHSDIPLEVGYQACASLKALYTLAARCPKLTKLSLRIDIHSCPELSVEEMTPRFTSLEKLGIWGSTPQLAAPKIERIRNIAVAVARVCSPETVVEGGFTSHLGEYGYSSPEDSEDADGGGDGSQVDEEDHSSIQEDGSDASNAVDIGNIHGGGSGDDEDGQAHEEGEGEHGEIDARLNPKAVWRSFAIAIRIFREHEALEGVQGDGPDAHSAP